MPPLSPKKLRLLALSSLFAVIPLPGWGKETVELKALCFPKQDERSAIELLIGEEETIEVTLQSHEFTLPLTVPKLAEWQFGESGTDTQGNFTFTPHAKVVPIKSGKQLLLFIRKGPENKDGFSIIPLDQRRLRGKDYLILNLTDGPISGIVGGQPFRLPPTRRAILKPKADRGEDLCFASLRYRRDEKWRSFFSSNWRLRERSRALIFVYQVAGQRSPRIHSVIDPL